MHIAYILLLICASSVGILCKSTAVVSNHTEQPNFLREILGPFRGPGPINVTHFFSTFQLPSCMKQCFPEMDGLLKAIAKSNNTEDVAEICKELQSSARCASTVGCSELFTEATASAFHFICLDNFQSIHEAMECMKTTVGDIQPECEARCEVQSQMLDDASKNKIDKLFNGPRACNSTRCLLTCFKEKIDERCETGQTRMLDTLVKEVMRDYGEGKAWEDAIDYIMPKSCKEKVHEKKWPLQKEESASEMPKSVRKVNKTERKKKKSLNNKAEQKADLELLEAPSKKVFKDKVKETTVIVDGEIRTLRYELFDWLGKPVQSPDVETLARIITQKFLPSSEKTDHPKSNTVRRHPSKYEIYFQQNKINGNSRVEDLPANEASSEWRPEERPEIISGEVEAVKEGVSVTIGLAIFVATVLYWLWETARDIN